MYPTGHIGIPFMTSYPIITFRGREGVPIKHGEGFFIKYIFKMEPYTRGAFKFLIEPDANTKACAIVITHIGANFPCTEPPPAVPTGRENIAFAYDTDANQKKSEFGEHIWVQFSVCHSDKNVECCLSFHHRFLTTAGFDQLGPGPDDHRSDPGRELHPTDGLLPDCRADRPVLGPGHH